MRRALIVAALAGVAVVMAAPAAQGHALLRSSDPEAGAVLDEAPRAVTIAFTEAPELSLSSIEVLDLQGGAHHTGALEVAPDDQQVLRRSVEDLAEGVYTVTWKVLSKVDGHVTGGAFAFGIGVDPSEAEVTIPTGTQEPPLEPLEVAGRWLLFIGLGLMIGAAWIGAAAFAEAPGGVWRLLWIGLAGAVAGVVVLAEAQRQAAGVGIGTLLGTPIGRSLIWRAIGIVLAGVLIRVARALVASARSRTLLLVGAAAAATALVHVAAGHAGAGSTWPVKVVSQWVHVVAVGVWLGGLAALLVGVRGEPAEEKSRAVKRFSTVAGVALFVVFGTGVARALNELPTWGDLVGSSYGVVILIKVAMIAVLGVLGAINRYRNVPAARSSLTGLRKVSRAELGVAGVVLLAAGLLASLTPPQPVSATEQVALNPVVVEGTDLGRRVHVELRIDPGFPGPNTFTARITEARTGAVIDARRASLLFRYLEDPGVGESELSLEQRDDGAYTASAGTMALPGRWRISVLVQEATDSTEIALQAATKCRAEAFPVEGGPTLYDVTLGRGSGQGYVDPGERGFNEVHITFFSPDGTEVPMADGTMMFAAPVQGERIDMVVRRFSEGHFIADAQLEPGLWRFDIEATTAEGETVRLCFNEEITR